MKELKGSIFIQKNGYTKRWEIIVTKNFIDGFGKPLSWSDTFSDFATKSIAEREMPKETIQAINCGYKL